MSRSVLSVSGLAACILFTSLAAAETWTDSTGKFRIEAEFVGVEGTSIVLQKADGKTVKVPINRLSAESRAKAKKLYEMAKAGGGSSTPAPGSSAPPASAPPPAALPVDSPASSVPLNFTPPTPPAVTPLPPFPEDASLQATYDFVSAQILAGHPEVLWYALPDDVRATLDSDEMRSVVLPAIKQQAKANKQTEPVIMKAIEVLVTKKDFLLNSPLLAQVPPPILPTIREAYDPAVGVIYELMTLSFRSDAIEKMTITQLVDHHGPRIGGHLQALAKMAPPGMVDGFISQTVVAQSGDTSGSITTPNNTGGTDTTEMVKYQGRWVPKEFADMWEAKKDTLVAELKAQVDAVQQNPQAAAQAEMMLGGFVTMANGVLDPMLRAKTQQEFDQAVMQVAAMMGALGGGGPGGPGGFGVPGGGPGQPGGLELQFK